MTICWSDTETYCEIPIRNGTYAYAEGVEVMLWAYALDDEPVQLWDLTDGSEMPADLKLAVETADVDFVFHNSMFDRTVIRHGLGIDIPAARIHDTMVQALAHSLPAGLSLLCDALGADQDKTKDKRGKQLIQLFCKPGGANRKLHRATRETHPEEWDEFCEYAKQDIVAMREAYKKMPVWNYKDHEKALWVLDQEINDRGFLVDLDLAESAVAAIDRAQKRLSDDVSKRTNGAVTAATQRDKLLKYILEAHNVALPDMTKSTLERRLYDKKLPKEVRELIAIRLQANKSSTSKYKALMNAASSDGRLRGTLQFCGASRTGRDAGRTFQPQNLMRPTMSTEEIEVGIKALKEGRAHLITDNEIELAANTVRGLIVAPEGKKLVVSDLSNIEGRVLAWLAGEDSKIAAFEANDAGTGEDIYNITYGGMFGVDPRGVTAGQRQVGKTLELACFTGDTRILTSTGVKTILQLETDDLLWDGTEWVRHEGLVVRGVKQVVNVAGTEVTPDHLIRIEKTWKPAQKLASNVNILYRALETGSENLPSLGSFTDQQAASSWSKYRALAGLKSIKYKGIIYVKGLALGALNAIRNLKVVGKRITPGTRISYLKIATGLDYSVEYPRVSTGATTLTTGGILTTADGVSKCTRSGGRTGESFLYTLPPLKGGIPPISRWTGRTSIRGTSRVISGLLRRGLTTRTDVRSKICRTKSISYKPVYDIMNVGPRSRFTVLTDRGPVIVHNCGFGGGVGAFLAMATLFKLDLDDLKESAWDALPNRPKIDAQNYLHRLKSEEHDLHGLKDDTFVACDTLKRMWRDAHPATTSLWYDLEDKVKAAIKRPGHTYSCGKYIKVRRDGSWLRLVLPSGRALCYPNPGVNEDGEIFYKGTNPYSRKWCNIHTYSGKIAENLTQAAARDVFAHSWHPAEAAGYKIIMRIHDELVTEVPDTSEFSEEGLSAILATVPSWAEGLPLAAGGFEATRYRKD